MLKKLVSIGLTIFMCCGFLAACGVDMSFENRCKTTEDGFVYYEDSKIGLCLISLPDSEEVVIPEFIDDKPVKQLGYKEISIGNMRTHTVDGSKVKKLTIQHTIDYFAVSFPNVDTLVYVDYPYCVLKKLDVNSKVVKVSANLGGGGPIRPVDIILTKSSRTIDLTGFDFNVISIPLNITNIDAQVFGGIDGVTIKTVYESKPDGWADGWNGDNEVEWGVEL